MILCMSLVESEYRYLPFQLKFLQLVHEDGLYDKSTRRSHGGAVSLSAYFGAEFELCVADTMHQKFFTQV